MSADFEVHPVGEIARVRAERDALRAFAQDVMRCWPEGGIDGGDLQHLA